MYDQFFGLRKSPFNMTPDPEFLYLTPQHREALVGLTYAVLGRKGFVVLTGDAGTGKTTLLARALRQFPVNRIQSSVIVNPTLTPSEFLEATLLDFGFADVPASKARRIANLQTFLLKARQEGKISALIVDEAHKLSADVLEEIRLLGNFDFAGEKLLQVALLGQSELDDLLNREHLRQFKQRIALRLSLQPLSAADTQEYIRYRWMKAGGSGSPFSADAIDGIAQASEGIPRLINAICDNALLQAFGEGSASVQARHVLGACEDLRLTKARDGQRTTAPPLLTPAPVMTGYPIKTLERYVAAAAKPSLLARFAGRIGLGQRVETV